jgi:hypothetical protein
MTNIKGSTRKPILKLAVRRILHRTVHGTEDPLQPSAPDGTNANSQFSHIRRRPWDGLQLAEQLENPIFQYVYCSFAIWAAADICIIIFVHELSFWPNFNFTTGHSDLDKIVPLFVHFDENE